MTGWEFQGLSFKLTQQITDVSNVIVQIVNIGLYFVNNY